MVAFVNIGVKKLSIYGRSIVPKNHISLPILGIAE
jgi:hypothetical protein